MVFKKENKPMEKSHANIDRAAAFVAATLSTLGFVAVATRLLTAIGTRRGIHGALRNRRGCLGLSLRNRFGSVLRQSHGRNRGLQRGNLHAFPRLTSTTIKRFSHSRYENTVNCDKVNAILNKNSQTNYASYLKGVFIEWVQS
jgi:hypothetical protein